MTATGILQDQIDYYRARAAEYDEWWFRGGRYDRGAELNARWHADTAAVDAALIGWLEARRPRRVLELACGTGFSPATRPAHGPCPALALRRRCWRSTARAWAPATWSISRRICLPGGRHGGTTPFFQLLALHVPPDRFDAFWAMVRQALEPGGAAYLIDSAFDRTSTAKDHVLPGQSDGVVTRRLNDGREFRIVKVFYEPGDLTERLRRVGWNAAVDRTANYFIYGSAEPHPGDSM